MRQPKGWHTASAHFHESRLRVSMLLIALLAGVHLLAASATLTVLGAGFQGASLVSVLAVLLFGSVRAELRRGRATLRLDSCGGATLLDRGDVQIWAATVMAHVDLGWAVWLHGDGEARTGSRRACSMSLMVLPDHFADRNDWRRFRVWLRHGPGSAAADGAISDGDC